jgi:tetratricopeptide (TPR) repeat protein
MLVSVGVLFGGVALSWLRWGRRAPNLSDHLQASVDGWRLEEGEAAEAAFAALLAALPGSGRHAEAARRLLDVRAWAWAATVCRQGLEARPDDAPLRFLLASAQTAMLEPEGILALTRHMQDHPGDVSTRLLLARSLLRLRRLEEVVSLLRRPVEVQDASAEELSLLGQAWFHLGHSAQAIRCLERARQVRVERRRHVVSVYEAHTEGGQDLRHAPADFWADEEDRLLLEELRTPPAP